MDCQQLTDTEQSNESNISEQSRGLIQDSCKSNYKYLSYELRNYIKSTIRKTPAIADHKHMFYRCRVFAYAQLVSQFSEDKSSLEFLCNKCKIDVNNYSAQLTELMLELEGFRLTLSSAAEIKVLIRNLLDISNVSKQKYYGHEHLYVEYAIDCIESIDFCLEEDPMSILEYYKVSPILYKYYSFSEEESYDQEIFNLIMNSYYTLSEWKAIFKNLIERISNPIENMIPADNLKTMSENADETLASKIYFIVQSELFKHIKRIHSS